MNLPQPATGELKRGATADVNPNPMPIMQSLLTGRFMQMMELTGLKLRRVALGAGAPVLVILVRWAV